MASGLSGRNEICLLDECDGLSTLEGQSIERLACHEHLLQTWDLYDHARDFGSQWGQILLRRLVRWNLLEQQIDVGVNERADQVTLTWLITIHELWAVHDPGQTLQVELSDVTCWRLLHLLLLGLLLLVDHHLWLRLRMLSLLLRQLLLLLMGWHGHLEVRWLGLLLLL